MDFLAPLALNINYKAVLAAAFAGGLIGSLWYSKFLFGPAWMRLIGKTHEDLMRQGSPAKAIAFSLVWSVVTAYVLALVLFTSGAATLGQGLLAGFLLWLGFVAAVRSSEVLFAGQPKRLYLLNCGYELAAILAMSAVLTLWQ